MPKNKNINIDYTNRDFQQLWFSRRQLRSMVSNNYREVWFEEGLKYNFGKNWNIYYYKKGQLVKYSNPNYYRYKYMNKLGFNITFKPRNKPNKVIMLIVYDIYEKFKKLINTLII